MNVIHFVDSFSPIGGGSQTAVLTWMSELVASHNEVNLEVVSNKTPIVFPVSADHRIILPTLDLSRFFPHYSISYRVPPHVEQQLIAFKPDLIHLHEPQFLTNHFVNFAKMHNIPVLATFHTNYGWYLRHLRPPAVWISQVLFNAQDSLFRHADALTTSTNYWRDYNTKIYQKHVYTVPISVESSFFQCQPTKYQGLKENIKLVTVSRLSNEKRIDILIKSLLYLDEIFTLTIVGEGAARRSLLTLVQQLGLSDRVTFVGWKTPTEQVSLYHNHHLFLSASAFETFGLTHIEALATGTPCVTADVPVSREVIPAGTAEFIKSDDPKNWANQITEIFATSKYDNMLEAVKKTYPILKNYTSMASTEALVRVYEQVIRQSGK